MVPHQYAEGATKNGMHSDWRVSLPTIINAIVWYTSFIYPHTHNASHTLHESMANCKRGMVPHQYAEGATKNGMHSDWRVSLPTIINAIEKKLLRVRS
jgi:hypothetical protein